MPVQCLFTALLIWEGPEGNYSPPSYITLRMRGAMDPFPILLLVWLFAGIRKYYVYFNHPHLGDGCTFQFALTLRHAVLIQQSLTVPTVSVLVPYFVTIFIAHCEHLHM